MSAMTSRGGRPHPPARRGLRPYRTGESSRSTSTPGSRRTAAALGSRRRRRQLELLGVVEHAHPAFADQPFVHRPELALEGGEHGRAERHGLAVHRPARRDRERRVGDQRLRVDRVLGDQQPRNRPSSPRCEATRGQHDRLHAVRERGARTGARAPRRTGRCGSGGRARPPAACARRRSDGPHPARARPARRGRARSRTGSTPPSGPRSGAACRARRSGAAARAGSPRAPPPPRPGGS